MGRLTSIGWTVAAVALTIPAAAQILPSPRLDRPIDGVLGAVPDVGPNIGRVVDDVGRLARDRVERLRSLARRAPDAIDLDPDGNPVRAGELVVVDADAALIDRAGAQGFALMEQATLDEIGVGYARFRSPRGLSIGAALRRMRGLAGEREVSADPLHFASGAAAGGGVAPIAGAPVAGGSALRIGIIDGGVADARVPGVAAQRAFASGGPAASDHATAIASLLVGGGGVRPSAPGAALVVADVYGRDPAGGGAVAIARALAWMVGQRVPVVVVSLVGPPNPLLARTVAAARARGTLVVAAVGNDGPAAPPAYPASYPGAVAVTGVDRRDRPLIEAGRALHLDYAAPGADMLALGANGRARTVRGTSFAAPLVAARLAAQGGSPEAMVRAVDGEARDLGPRERIGGSGAAWSAARAGRFRNKFADAGLNAESHPFS